MAYIHITLAVIITSLQKKDTTVYVVPLFLENKNQRLPGYNLLGLLIKSLAFGWRTLKELTLVYNLIQEK